MASEHEPTTPTMALVCLAFFALVFVVSAVAVALIERDVWKFVIVLVPTAIAAGMTCWMCCSTMRRRPTEPRPAHHGPHDSGGPDVTTPPVDTTREPGAAGAAEEQGSAGDAGRTRDGGPTAEPAATEGAHAPGPDEWLQYVDLFLKGIPSQELLATFEKARDTHGRPARVAWEFDGNGTWIMRVPIAPPPTE